MFPSDLCAFTLLQNQLHFVPGCRQLVVGNAFLYHEIQFLHVDCHQNALWILVVKFYLFVVSIEIHCDHFAAVHFTDQAEKDGFRVFGCYLNVLSFLCVLDDLHVAIAGQIKDINDEFEFLFFGGIPLENDLIFAAELEGEALSDGKIEDILGLLELLVDPLGELLVELLLHLGLKLDLHILLFAFYGGRGWDYDWVNFLIDVDWDCRNGLDLLHGDNRAYEEWENEKLENWFHSLKKDLNFILDWLINWLID